MADQLPGNLDPKLKEVYDRVMGTNAASAGNATPPPIHTAAPTPTHENLSTPAQPTTEPATNDQRPTTLPSTPTPQPTVFTTTNQGFVAGDTKEKKGMSPMILVLVGVVFLIVYTIFWIKLFNVPIPFISQ